MALVRKFSAIILIVVAAVAGYFVASARKPMAQNAAAEQGPATCAKPAAQAEMAWIEGGVFTQGATGFYPEEGPPRTLEVKGFWIDKFEVTNAQFSEFVAATGYVTVAEREPDPQHFPGLDPALLTPGSAVFVMPTAADGKLTQWWRFIPGANWREPAGPGGATSAGREHHPVVHIAYEDALAYANWKGRALPTEAQWEYAARGGLEQAVFAWGDEFSPEGKHQANTWQGMFPALNANEDGFPGTAPVGCFPANGYGLHDMIGNVWEWVDDWYYPERDPETATGAPGHDPRQPGVPVKVIKGGSYLCAKNYCRRYRPAARHPQELALGAAHLGFRTVKNPAP